MTGCRSAILVLPVQAAIVATVAFIYSDQLSPVLVPPLRKIAVLCGFLIPFCVLSSVPVGSPMIKAIIGDQNAFTWSMGRALSVSKSSEYKAASFSMRLTLWRETGRMIKANPLTGVGAGSWEVKAPLYQDPGTVTETDYYAHNEILQIIAEYGLVGVAVCLGLLSYLVWAAARTARNRSAQSRQEAPLRWLALLSVVTLLWLCNVSFPLHMACTGALLALSIGILAASDTRVTAISAETDSALLWSERHLSRPVMRWAPWGAGSLVLVAVYISTAAVRAEYNLVWAAKTALTISRSGKPNDPRWADSKTEMLRRVQVGMAINPHYRKITNIVGEELANWGDWKNAAGIMESVSNSRPHVVALACNAARAHINLGDIATAAEYFQRASRAQPEAVAVKTLQVIFLTRMGQLAKAEPLASKLLEAREFDDQLAADTYLIGTQLELWQMAIESQELRIVNRPEQSSDAYLMIATVYVTTHNDAMALAAYTAAIQHAPPLLRGQILQQMPEKYRLQVQKSTGWTTA